MGGEADERGRRSVMARVLRGGGESEGVECDAWVCEYGFVCGVGGI